MIDGYEASCGSLDNRTLVFEVLDKLPEEMGMKKLSPPQVFWAPAISKKDSGGWSGFVVIQESHISIHTFPRRGFISADIYTCQNNMDTEKVQKYLRKAFSIKDMEINFVKRGTKYPEKDLYS